MQLKSKILIIRFSSFGDVTQSLSLPSKLNEKFSQAEIHWVTRSEFYNLIQTHPFISKVWSLDRKLGLKGLLQLAWTLRHENFTHIYDAHNNLRSHILSFILTLFKSVKFVRRPIYRWKRFFLFKFRKNFFRQPFSGQRDLIEPLATWGIDTKLPPCPQIFSSTRDEDAASELLKDFPNSFITLAPSAAYYLKRWPKNYWNQLINLFPKENFVLLGGPQDHFIKDIAQSDAKRCLNLSGKCDLTVNIAIIRRSKLLISNDTGLMHIAEQLGHPCVAFMGPAPFGFPSRESTIKMELPLKCRPCSKHGQGPCKNLKFHQCLVDITPDAVASVIAQWTS